MKQQNEFINDNNAQQVSQFKQRYGSKRKNNRQGSVTLIVIVAVLVASLIGFVIWDQVKIEEQAEKIKQEEKKKELDLTRCLNNPEGTYSNAQVAPNSNYGLEVNLEDGAKNVMLSIKWGTFGPISTASAWSGETKSYQIAGFTKEIKEVFIGDMGQDSMGITIFYLMEDGTVEYTPMFVQKVDTKGKTYYDMNYTYEYTPDNKVSKQYFKTNGPLSGITGVTKLHIADYSNGFGAKVTIGQTEDGSFYDLSKAMN